MSEVKSLMFVFDRMPDQDGCIFIEVENAEGQSVCAGEWRDRDDGLVELVVPVSYDDAQRLRADTAEAELTKALELLNVSYQLLGLNSALVSYRVHMGEIGEFIRMQKNQYVPRCPNCGYTEQDCREQMDHYLCGFPEPARAALNPSPEAESHE